MTKMPSTPNYPGTADRLPLASAQLANFQWLTKTGPDIKDLAKRLPMEDRERLQSGGWHNCYEFDSVGWVTKKASSL